MKSYFAGLQSSVSAGTYNKTQTSMLGRVFQKTINSQLVMGPALTNFIDTQTTAGIAPLYTYFVPGQNLLFAIQNVATALPIVIAYTFNNNTGAYAYLGKVTLNLANAAATTTTIRGLAAYSDGTNVRIIFAGSGSVTINSGVYVAYCPLTAFTVGGTQLYPASGSGQNAIYLLQASDYYGANAVTGFMNTLWGVDYAYLSSNSAVNTKILAMANTLAAPTALEWDLATAPTVAGTLTNGVSAATTSNTNLTTAAYFNMATNPGYAGGAFYEPVVLMSGTGSVPTAFTAWNAGTLQVAATNVYFTRDIQQLYTFTCSALASGISAGSTYTNNGLTFTVVVAASAAATTFVAWVSPPAVPGAIATPTATGTLTRTAGTGDATITFSAATAGLFYFNLATTSGGAAVVPTSTTSNFTMMRAFGTSTNSFVVRTPIAGFSPALSGALLQTNVVQYSKPTSAPQNVALNNQDCLFIGTSTTGYLGKISDLLITYTGTTTFNSTTISGFSSVAGLATGMSVIGAGIPPGATISSIGTTSIVISTAASASGTVSINFGTNTWSSLTASNILGTGIDVVVPTATFARYGGQGLATDVDRLMVVTNTSSFILKPLQNNIITSWFGGVVVNYLETLNPVTTQVGFAAVTGLDLKSGWMFITNGTTTGQRGIIYADIVSDTTFGYSAAISPVLSLPSGTTFKEIDTLEQLFDYTDSLNFYIRSAATATDTSFNTANIPTYGALNGWTLIKTASDLSSVAIGPFFQLCATWQVLTLDANTHAQLNDIKYTVILPGEISDNWDWSYTGSSTGSPSRSAFYLSKAYTSSVPQMYFRWYDVNGNLLGTADTVTNASNFSYSTDGGNTWNSLGTIPNTVGTLVRYTFTSPPGVSVVTTVRES